MPEEENSFQRLNLSSLENSKYSGININVNGGYVCLMIGQDLNDSKVRTIVNSGKFKKKSKLKKVKQWFQKKFTSHEELSLPVQVSDSDLSTSTSITDPLLPGESPLLPSDTGSSPCASLCKSPLSPSELDSSSSRINRHHCVAPFLPDDELLWKERKPVEEETCDSSVTSDGHASICTNVDDTISKCEINTPLLKGSLLTVNECDNSNTYNDSSVTDDRECTGLKESLQPQENLHLKCDYENSSHLKLDVLKTYCEKKSAAESTNKQNKVVDPKCPDSLHAAYEKSFSSGYPVKTMSSGCFGNLQSLSNDSLSNQMFDSYLELEQDKHIEDDHCFDNTSVQSKAVEKERCENVHYMPLLSTIIQESQATKFESFSSNVETSSKSDQNSQQTQEDKTDIDTCFEDEEIDLIDLSSIQYIENSTNLDQMCGHNDELVQEESTGSQNEESFEVTSDTSNVHGVEKEVNVIDVSLSPCIQVPIAFNEHSTSFNKDEMSVCPNSGFSQDTMSESERLEKSDNWDENVDNEVLKPSKDIDCFASMFHNDADVTNFLLICLRNWIFNVLSAVHQTSVGSKSFGKCLVANSTRIEKRQCDIGADYTNSCENEKQQVGVRDRNMLLERPNLKFDILNFIHSLFYGKNGEVTAEKFSLYLCQNKLDMLHVQVINSSVVIVHVTCARKLVTDEPLIVPLPEKQTEANTVIDNVLMESRQVLDSTSSDIEYLDERKFNDKLHVVTEELPFEIESDKFSHSTLPVSGFKEPPQEKKPHKPKKKKKLRRKCQKLVYLHGETSSLESSSINEDLTDDDYLSSSNKSIPDDDRPPLSMFFCIPQINRPSRRKQSPETNKSIDKEDSDIKQLVSNERDSGLGSSIISNGGSSIEGASPTKTKKRTKSRCVQKSYRRYSLKKVLNRFFSSRQKKTLKSIVRELHVDHRHLPSNVFVLGSYFDRLNNGSPPSQQEQMHYEWLRLASFQHYTGAGNAINLARNGFYHQHTDGPLSTRCVYCDFTCNSWEYFDDVADTHRRLSPNCPLHNDHSEESLNVSINCDGPVSTANQNSSTVSSSSENIAVTTTSTCRISTEKPTMTLTAAVNEVTRGLEATHVSQAKPNNTNAESVAQQPTEDPEGTRQRSIEQQRHTGDSASGLRRTSNNVALPPLNTENRATPSRTGAGNFVDPSPVGKHTPQPPAPAPENRDASPPRLDNVKHPEYRTMAQRVNSYNGFPEYLDQTPEQMSLAGFYFVGVADFTRCFCCGGGLRNWEAGDDPLLEHTRWFPRCGYILRLKGERYVAAVQRRHQEHMAQQRRQQIELANQRDANRTAPDPMTTDAARVMREMGYPDQRIRDTILAVRRQIGTHLITTQQVLSWLLDQDDDTATAVSRSMYQTGNDTSSIYTGINMTSDNDETGSFTTATQFTMNSNVSSTAAKTRESVQGSGTRTGTNTTTTTSTATSSGNQQTDTKSAAAGADTSQGGSSQSGTKKSGKKKKGKGNGGKPGQAAGATTGAAGATGGAGATRAGGDPDAAKKLQAENEKLRDMQTCKICMERLVNTTLLPCGHLVCCDICAARLRDCPVCRKQIKGTVKTFMS